MFFGDITNVNRGKSGGSEQLTRCKSAKTACDKSAVIFDFLGVEEAQLTSFGKFDK